MPGVSVLCFRVMPKLEIPTKEMQHRSWMEEDALGAGGRARKCRGISLKLVFAFSQQSTELPVCSRCS